MKSEVELSFDREEGYCKLETSERVIKLTPHSARRMAEYLAQIADESEKLYPDKFKPDFTSRYEDYHPKPPKCEHEWERQPEWCGEDDNRGKTQRHKCKKCGIWGYSNPPYRINPAPYAGPITEPQSSWKKAPEGLRIPEIRDESPPPEVVWGKDKPIGWSPPEEWIDPEE